MKLRLQSFVRGLADRLFQKPAGLTALATDETFGFHSRLTVGQESDFNSLQATPPT